MLSAYASNATLSKARAMYGKRLKYHDYMELINCSNVIGVATYLKNNTAYSSILSDVNETTIHRGQLEIILKKKLFYDLAKLERYEISVGEYFSKYIISRVEIEQILYALILLKAGRINEYIYSIPLFFNKLTHVDLMSFSKVSNLDEFLELLKGSPYYNILKSCNINSNSIDLTLIENQLYTYLYQIIFDIIDKYLNKTSSKIISDLFNTFIDAHNIVRIIRLKKYYKAKPEFIKSIILPFGTLKNKQIESIIYSEEKDNLSNIIKNTYLGNKIKNIEYNYIDEIPSRIKFFKCKKNIRFSIEPSVVLLSYIFLTEIELSNIINIIEGVRYKLPVDEIEKMLIYNKNDK